MTSLFAGLIAVALTTLGNVDPDASASASVLHYSVQFDEATGSASLQCHDSSTGSCTFWVGDSANDSRAADGSGTLAVGATPVIVRVKAASPGYCAGTSEQAPPKWPECTRGPLGGTLDRSASVDYRRN